jgi:hypothetical protein
MSVIMFDYEKPKEMNCSFIRIAEHHLNEQSVWL